MQSYTHTQTEEEGEARAPSHKNTDQTLQPHQVLQASLERQFQR